MPSSSRNSSILMSLNSVPLSLLTFLIFNSNSFWVLFANFLKVAYTSLLSCKKNTHVKRK
uniref:Uncharacterized protein n=1 Tax=Arundo donax TaxID=35708 RepID=A0A0A9I0X9_ARUDO